MKNKEENGKQGREKISTVYIENVLHCLLLGVTTLLSNLNARAKKTSS